MDYQLLWEQRKAGLAMELRLFVLVPYNIHNA